MKKIMVVCALGAGLLIYACGGNENKNAEKKEEKTEKKAGMSDADREEAITMIAGLDCSTCHKINEKVIGPSYAEVAKKYETSDAVITDLSTKIIKGGQGVWGSVPMTPHPNLSMDSAKVMVKYILSLKNQ